MGAVTVEGVVLVLGFEVGVRVLWLLWRPLLSQGQLNFPENYTLKRGIFLTKVTVIAVKRTQPKPPNVLWLITGQVQSKRIANGLPSSADQSQ